MQALSSCFTTSAPLKLLVPAVLGCAALCVPHRIFAEEERAQLAGTVRDSVTSAPTKGMEVLLEPAGGPTDYMTVANADGAFSFRSVEAGNYHIGLHRQGYRYLPANQTNLLIHLEPGQKLSGIDLTAVPLGSISGTALDSEGEPVVDASVRVMKPQFWHGRRIWVEVLGLPFEFRHTDDRGRYRIDDLEAGEYCVHISPPRIDLMIRPVQDAAPGGPEMAAIPVYYPGVATLTEASRVRVGPGQELIGIDVKLPSKRTFHIRGPADPKWADPAAGVFHNSPYVVARYDDGRIKDWAEFRGVMYDDGSFDIPSMPAGDYRVQIMRRSEPQSDSAAASIQNADATGVRLSRAKFDVKIKTSVEGDPTASTPVWASLEPVDRLGAALSTWRQQDTIESVSPGHYLLRIAFSSGSHAGAYAKHVLVDGQEVTTPELDLRGPANLEIVLAQGTRQIVGSLDISSPFPPDLSAILVPEQLRPGGWTSVYHSDIDQRGQFVFWSVAPGTYRAFLVSGYDEGLWENRDFSRSLADLGTVVLVPEGGAGELPIKLGPTLLSPVEVERAASRIGN